MLLAATVAAVGLAACESRTSWIKESADAGQLQYDQQECGRSASNYGFVDRGDYGVGRNGTGATSMTSGEYRRCMEARGWRRERTP
jgi:hypothetical protein